MDEQSKGSSTDLERLLSGLPADEADDLRRTWQRAGASIPRVDETRAEAVWHVLSVAVDEGSVARRTTVPPRRTSMQLVTWQRAAAIAAVLVLVSAALLVLRPQRLEYSAGVGETTSITLPDGSSAVLNSATFLHYRSGFWGSRNVLLDGEAYFDVAVGDRLFMIETFNARVRVVGTRFNVRARRDDHEPSTLVSVDEGTVGISARGTDHAETRLTSGYRAKIEAQNVRVLDDEASVDDAGAWRNGDLVFKDESLGVVLDEVARRFDVPLRTSQPQLRSIRLSLVLREATDVETVLGAACVALDLRYRPVSGGFEIYSPDGS